MTSREAIRTDIRDALVADHRRLDALLEELRACAPVDAPCDLDATWTTFETGLLAHFDWEGMFLLPAFEQHAPREAESFRVDHARIRSEMGELGVLIEIHAVRQEQIEELVQRLRAHAAREESTLYQWADIDLPTAARPSLLRRLRRALEHAAAAPGATVKPEP